MKIDLNQLMTGLEHKKTYQFDYNISEENLLLLGAYESKSVVIKGSIEPVEDYLSLDIDIEGEILFNCSRCTDKVVFRIQECFNRVIRVNTGKRVNVNEFIDLDQEDSIDLDGKILDLEPVVMEELFLFVPLQVVCSEDCMGLCSECGKKKESCDCLEDRIDPRLEALKKFSSK